MAFLEHGAILAFVLTREGAVRLNLYTADAAWVVERMNEALADKPPMPIDLFAEKDAQWAEYDAVLRATGMSD